MKRAMALAAAVAALTACGGGDGGSARGLTDTIAIEGHWTIDVVDPDGSLDQRIEFQNAIMANGWETIGRLMAGEWGMHAWFIGLNGTFCDQVNNYCGLDAEAAYDATGQATVVSGSITAPQDGDIDLVRAASGVCRFDVQRDCVPDAFSNFFSAHDIDPVVTVTGGQIVQIEIRYTLG